MTSGLSGVKLGEALSMSKDKISKIERGKQYPNAEEIRAWVTACGGTDTAANELIRLLTESRSIRLDWDRRLTAGQGAVQASYLDLHTAASVIINVEPLLIPGPLQTPGYARQVLSWSEERHGRGATDLERGVANRLAAGQFLHDPTKQWTFVITEAALRFRYVDDDEMLAQLDRLLSVVGLSNVVLGIIPLDVPLAGMVPAGFVIYDDQVVVETYGEEHHYRGGDKLDTYQRGLKEALAMAVTGANARALILADINRRRDQP